MGIKPFLFTSYRLRSKLVIAPLPLHLIVTLCKDLKEIYKNFNPLVYRDYPTL